MLELNFLLFKIKQALCKKKKIILIQKKNIYFCFLIFLVRNNYIRKYSIKKSQIIIFLNYTAMSKSVINNIITTSTKANLKYISYKNLFLYNLGNYVLILLTTHGYLTHHQALKKKIGGLLFCILY